MIRVYVRSGDERYQELVTRDPVAAEAHYLRHVREAELGDVVCIEPGRGDRIEPAEYRADHPRGTREHAEARHRQLWAHPSNWIGPTPEQLHGLVLASGMSHAALARALDVPIRTWHEWKSARPKRGISYAAWVAALHVTGLMPAGEHVSPLAGRGMP